MTSRPEHDTVEWIPVYAHHTPQGAKQRTGLADRITDAYNLDQDPADTATTLLAFLIDTGQDHPAPS